MPRLNITAKIWLSVGVFIVGYVLSTALSQIQDHEARTSLRATSEALFPAAQHSQEAESAFQRMVKGFGDAVIMQDASGLDRAAEDGRQTVAALKSVAGISGLAADRSAEAGRLASSIGQMLSDAGSTYGAVMAGAMSASTQEQMRALASRTDEAKASLAKTKEQLAADLHQQLSSLENSSARQSSLALAVFAVTLIVAGVIVHVTIRRAITGHLQQIVVELGEGANQMASAASQVASSSQSLARGSSEQAASLQETSASAEEVSAAARKNADTSKTMAADMQLAGNIVAGVNDAIQRMGGAVASINSSSDEIAKIIKVIDEIAFQTNILALNAAVEAARAGEAGMGFAVVADEVRNLAQRCAQAARDTASLIEKSVQKSREGKLKVDEVTKAMQANVAIATKIGAQVDEVSLSSQEQNRGLDQIAKAITQMEQVTQKTAANAEESAAAAEELNAQSETLKDIVARLTVMIGGEAAKGGIHPAHRRRAKTSAARQQERSADGLAALRKAVAYPTIEYGAPVHLAHGASRDAFPLGEQFKES